MKKFSEITYTRPDFEVFKKDALTILEEIKAAKSFNELKELIYKWNRFNNDMDALAIVSSIRFSLDTQDEFYKEEQAWWDKVLPEFSLLSEKYSRVIVASPFRKDLIKEYGEQLFTIADFQIKKIDERIVEDRKEENKLLSEYVKLLASAKIAWNEEELNLSELAAFEESANRSIRKKAVEASFEFLGKNTKELDRIFDALVHTRDGMAKKIGFNNFVELGYCQMKRSDYTPEMVAKYREKILEFIVPIVSKLANKQSKRIGLDKLKCYDHGFKFNSGNPEPKGDTAWILGNMQKMFQELSPETDDFFAMMTKYELMDLDTRKGKKNGGYCTFLPAHSSPFIFSNSNGTSKDVRVLVHELGHAFQKHQSSHFKVSEYYWPTKESAEIHSMSLELFTLPWMDLFFKEDAEKYKFQHIASTIELLPHIACVDEFQQRVYEQAGMTPEERKALWRAIETKYKPNLDYDGNEFAESGGRWQQQSHIYTTPFYYIDYALAQVCALQFWVRMQDDFKGAWDAYLRLCKAGGSMPFLKLLELAELKSPFEDGLIEEVAAQVETYLDTFNDARF